MSQFLLVKKPRRYAIFIFWQKKKAKKLSKILKKHEKMQSNQIF